MTTIEELRDAFNARALGAPTVSDVLPPPVPTRSPASRHRLAIAGGVLSVAAVSVTVVLIAGSQSDPPARPAAPPTTSVPTQRNSPDKVSTPTSAPKTTASVVAPPPPQGVSAPPSSPSNAPGIQRLGTESAVRAAALRAPHPGLKICGNKLSVEQSVRVLIGPTDKVRAEYAAVLVTCQGATGSSPADVSIVEPYGSGPTPLYSIVTGKETFRGYYLEPQRLYSAPGTITVVFLGFSPKESTAAASHYFKRTFTIGTPSATAGSYSATSRPS